MTKVRVRRLWLNVRYKVPSDVSEERIIRTMIRSIKRKDYRLPKGWRAVIEWRNSKNAPMRRGEWQAELKASAESSSGFEFAVIEYLERKLR
jgi:hypothetical protein